MKNINQRIATIIDDSKLSNSEFADSIEVPRSSISHILSGRNKPSLDFLMKIKNEFPKYTWDWLIYGEGEMQSDLKKVTNEEIISKPKTASLPDLFSLLGDDQYGMTESEDTIIKSVPSDSHTAVQSESIKKSGDSQRLGEKEKISNQNPVDLEINKVKRIVLFYENGKFETFEP